MQAKAWEMQEAGMPGLGWGWVRWSIEGIWMRAKRMSKHGYTIEITAVQKFRLDVLPVMFRCLALDDFEHAG